MTEAKNGVISQGQFFFLIFVSRAVVSFTNVRAISVGNLSADILISFAVSYAAALLFSLPAVICLKKGKSPLKSKILSPIYSLYFLLFTAVNVGRFSYFASSRMNPRISILVFSFLILAAACYCAYLGIESLGRFASFCGVILLAVILVATVLNFDKFNILNFYPVWNNSRENMIMNTAVFTSNTIEPVLLLTLGDKVNKNPSKPYYLGVSLAFLSVLLLLAFCCGVLGAGADFRSFPIFTLFQLASFFNTSRMDILHTAFWVLGVLLKCSVLIYCCCECFKKTSRKKRSIISSAVAFLLTALIYYAAQGYIADYSKTVIVALFALLGVVVPTLWLIFSKGENENEKI